MATRGDTRRSWTRWVSTGFGIAIVVVTFVFVLPAFADYSEVWAEVTSMPVGWLVVLAGTTLLNLATYGITWQATTPGLGYRQSLELTMVSTAVSNVMPMGGALSVATLVGMLREWGFAAAVVARSLVVTGIFNQLANVALPVVSIAMLEVFEHQSNAALETVAGIGLASLVAMIVAFAVVLHSERGARLMGALWDRVATSALRLARRGPVTGSQERLVEFRSESVTLLRQRWWLISIAEIFGAATVFLVLLAALRGSGVDASQVTWIEAFAAWSFARLLAVVPLTPAGLGIVEIGLTGMLVGFGGEEAGVVAAVVLYRVLTFVPPLVLGGVAAFTWQRHHPPELRVNPVEPRTGGPVA